MAKIELTQEDLDAKIATAVTAAVEKLNTKNDDLKIELKKSRKRSEAFGDLDPEQVRLAVEKANKGEQKALEDKGEYEKALALATTAHATEVKSLTDQLGVAQGGEKELRTRTAIDSAMDEINIAPAFKKAVRLMHQGDVSIIDQDGKPAAMVGDKTVTDHLKAWADTDEGKNFVGDGGQGGGGAEGGKKSSGTVNPWAKETRNLSQQGLMERDNPSQAAQLKREAGAAA
jgi:hypothetical protein